MSGKSKRGFASMDRARQREIAAKGGRAAHAKGTAHVWSASEAREAGRKGGEAISQDRSHMSMIGKEGGASRSAAVRAARLRRLQDQAIAQRTAPRNGAGTVEREVAISLGHDGLARDGASGNGAPLNGNGAQRRATDRRSGRSSLDAGRPALEQRDMT